MFDHCGSVLQLRLVAPGLDWIAFFESAPMLSDFVSKLRRQFDCPLRVSVHTIRELHRWLLASFPYWRPEQSVNGMHLAPHAKHF